MITVIVITTIKLMILGMLSLKQWNYRKTLVSYTKLKRTRNKLISSILIFEELVVRLLMFLKVNLRVVKN
jgi:hypothetical protein